MSIMTEPTAEFHVVLTEDDHDGQIAVGFDTFLLFDNSISHGLDALERRWADWATPDSLRRDIWENIER